MYSKKSGIVSKYTFDWSLQKSSRNVWNWPPPTEKLLTTLVPPKTQKITAFSQLLKTLSPFVFWVEPEKNTLYHDSFAAIACPLFFFLKGNPSKKKVSYGLTGEGGSPLQA